MYAAKFARIVDIVRSCYPGERKDLPLHRPVLGELDKEYLSRCIDSSFVSNVGAYVTRFEEAVRKYAGASYAVATVNGTAALHMALLLSGVRPGDLVVTQALTFVATGNAILYCGALPVFLDVDRSTLGMDPQALRLYLEERCRSSNGSLIDQTTGRRVAACLPMSTFGHPADLPQLVSICAEHHLPLVEDAAEALGSFREDRHMGTFGLSGILSFNGNKIITTGGGGMILTNDVSLASRGRHLTTTAKRAHAWEYFHDAVGYNYRMPNLNAAMGCAQMQRLPALVEDKRRLAAHYATAFSEMGVEFVVEPSDCRSNYWLNAILFQDVTERDAFLAFADDAKIQCRPAWTPLHRLPMFAVCPRGDLPVTEDVAARLVNIPSSPRVQP